MSGWRRGASSHWRPFLLGAVVGAVLLQMFVHRSGSEDASAVQGNLAAGFIAAVRVGDPSACAMLTDGGKVQLERLLGVDPRAPAQLGEHCVGAVERSSASRRAAAMRPFAAIGSEWFTTLNRFTRDVEGTGYHRVSGSVGQWWSEGRDRQFGVMLIRHTGGRGWLIASLAVKSRCAGCS